MIKTAAENLQGKLRANITSYDLLKAVAVIIMITDHIGFYFYEDQNWWRAIGRIGFPIWFFLIGYARSRNFSPRLWVGAIMLLLGSTIVGMGIFPLNALFSMIIIRMILDPVMKFALKNAEILAMVCVALLVLFIPTFYLCEYSTQGLLLAMFGYVVRYRPDVKGIQTGTLLKIFAIFSLAHFTLAEGILFEFNLPQMIVMTCGLALVCYALYEFKAKDYPALTAKLPHVMVEGIQFMGRRTMEIYVAHLLLFKAMGVWLDQERFQLFHWAWMMS